MPYLWKNVVSFFIVVIFYSIWGFLSKSFLYLKGLHLFKGLAEYRCRLTSEPIDQSWPINEDLKNLCGCSSYDCPAEFKFFKNNSFKVPIVAVLMKKVYHLIRMSLMY